MDTQPDSPIADPTPQKPSGARRTLPIVLWLAAALALFAAGWLSAHLGLGDFLRKGDEDFEGKVRAYILDHPETLREAILKLQANEEKAAQSRQRAAIEANRDAIFADPASPVGGNPAGQATLVLFFDYKCPYCKRVTPDIEALIAADPDLRIVYKEFPILGPGSLIAARAALAAAKQNLYAPFHQAMMAHKGDIDEATIAGIAGEIGLDMEKLAADMKAPEILAELQNVQALADKLDIRSTPTFIIGGEAIAGALPLAELKSAIERARATATP